ncbi:MAG: hypothetical protein HY689_13785 [Chloroflexi bacterium]|nr:hypothetical protein [Chloroflexota bacterium]
MQRRFSLVLALALVLGAAIFPLAGIIRAAELSLSAASGMAGSTIAVSGSGFAAESTVTLRWGATDGTALGTATTDAAGAFASVSMTIPADATAGSHQLYASDGATTTSVTITVLPSPSITTSPTSGVAGAAISLSGQHFGAGATVTVRWDGSSGTVLGTTLANASGAFSGLTVFIPVAASVGDHLLSASDGTLSATTPLAVLPDATLVLTPSSGLPGTQVEAAGAGFGANGAVTLRWETFTGTVLATAATESSGAFTGVRIRIPADATTGSHTVHASDGTRSASAVLTVLVATATLTVAPTSQAPGKTVAASGTGYDAGEQVSLRWERAGGTVLATVTTDSSGAFSGVPITVPASASVGTHAIVVLGSTSGKQAVASLTVTQPAEGKQGRSHDDDDDQDNGGTRPGWGCGDRNHEHTGPRGYGGEQDSPCQRGGHGTDNGVDASAEDDDADEQDDEDDEDDRRGDGPAHGKGHGRGKGHTR